jgi:rhamnosyltransferase
MGMVARLASTLDHANGSGKTAAVGPLAGEIKPGGDQLVYRARTWGPRRATSEELACPLLPVAFLIASGCLIDMKALAEIGPMNEDLFIDHVDLEWGLRASREGYALLVDTRVTMAHSLGDSTVRLKGRMQPVHIHGPVRNYYLTRNTVMLIRSGLLGCQWTVGYVVWLAKYAAFNSLLVDHHVQRILMITHGFMDGLKGKGGRLPTR